MEKQEKKGEGEWGETCYKYVTYYTKMALHKLV